MSESKIKQAEEAKFSKEVGECKKEVDAVLARHGFVLRGLQEVTQLGTRLHVVYLRAQKEPDKTEPIAVTP